MTEKTEMMSLLYRTILNCTAESDVADLLSDLCTFQEVEQMAQRVTAAKLISEGKTYAEIIEQTGISSATLSRVSRAMQHGSGGYARLMPKQKDK